MTVKKGDVVSVHYTWTLQDETEFDSSYTRKTPLQFTVGAGQMIPWFDKAPIWMKIGEKKIQHRIRTR